MLAAQLYFFSSLITASFLVGVLATNGINGTQLLDYNGSPMVNAHANISLQHFENITSLDDVYSLDVPFTLHQAVTDDVIFLDELEQYSSTNHTSLAKRTNMRECASFAQQAGTCAFEYWDIANGVWQLGYEIFQSTQAGSCRTIFGSVGGFYYKYYPVYGNCQSTVHQKTVAGAIQYLIRKLEGNFLCNTYSITVDHYGTWHGTVIIGPSIQAWSGSIASSQYKGCYSAGCAELQEPYNCNSAQEGA